MIGKRLFWLLVAIILVVVFLGSGLVELVADFIWFGSMGYSQIFRTILISKIVTGLLGGLFALLMLFVNYYIALRRVGDPVRYLPSEIVVTPLGQLLTGKMIRRTAFFLCLGIGALAGLTAASKWEWVLLYLHGGNFNQVDPVFQRDVGFYIFSLPFWVSLQSYIFSIGLLALLGVGVIYFIQVQGERPTPNTQISLSDISTGARVHVAMVGAIMLIVWAWGLYLDRFEEMHRQAGLFTGPGFADIHGTIPVLMLKIIAVLVSAVILVFAMTLARYKVLIGGAALIVAVGVGGFLWTSILQQFVVKPNELAKEEPYIKNHIGATNRAFALDKVVVRSLTENIDLTARDIALNRATINNIRLWDHEPLLDTFAQNQEIRTYYHFLSVDNDRYVIDGELRQTMLSPREMNPLKLEESSRTWINERLNYTHGYGLTLGPVNRVNKGGQPVLFVKDLPPDSTRSELHITRPEIYFGEIAANYVFVKTRHPEFNYPKGDANITSRYEGEGGVWLGSFARRLLFAAYLRDISLLLADAFTPETRVLLFRNVNDRVQKIAQFFHLDNDPYLVIDNGRLFWIFDAYTVSSRYPYSEVFANVGNYMRNPVKVVVDSYTGEVKFYLVDPSDPIVQAYKSMFPGMLRPLADMPAGLRAHLRHPIDYFTVQTEIYTTYHMKEINTFYNKEDKWEVPVVRQKRMEPYFIIMKLPGEKKEEFILMLPFTPLSKDNLAAWMVARSDGNNYGQLVVYKFPKQKRIFGPKQMVGLMNQDAEVSQLITLWDQAGSNVEWGTLLVIPIESSLIYIQPIYLKAEEGKIPELKRVLVGYEKGNEDKEIAMGVNLEDSLRQIFGPKKLPPTTKQITARKTSTIKPGSVPTVTSSPTRRALDHYQAMQEATRSGDWGRFGKEMDALGKVLQQLAQPRQ